MTTHAQYIISPQWAAVRRRAWEKTRLVEFDLYKCPICFEDREGRKMQGHHWRYPAKFENDKPGNVIVMCEQCHKFVHFFAGGVMLNDKPTAGTPYHACIRLECRLAAEITYATMLWDAIYDGYVDHSVLNELGVPHSAVAEQQGELT